MDKRRYCPFILSAAVVAVDQISKALIVHFIPEGTVGAKLLSDFLWICHVRNDAVAFSIGDSLPMWMKYVFFIGLPLLLMVLLSVAIISKRFDGELSRAERWCLAGIVGGGVGNLLDRIFRSMRVVDWISTNNYGWFGMDRFPTYNAADASVVISIILLLLIALFAGRKTKKESPDAGKES